MDQGFGVPRRVTIGVYDFSGYNREIGHEAGKWAIPSQCSKKDSTLDFSAHPPTPPQTIPNLPPQKQWFSMPSKGNQ